MLNEMKLCPEYELSLLNTFFMIIAIIPSTILTILIFTHNSVCRGNRFMLFIKSFIKSLIWIFITKLKSLDCFAVRSGCVFFHRALI